MKFLVLALGCLFSTIVSAQNVNIIPLPKQVVNADGSFLLNNKAVIGVSDISLILQANFLQQELQRSNNTALSVDKNEQKATIDLKLAAGFKVAGAYDLNIKPDKITITASDNEGVFYGIISLLHIVRTQSPWNGLKLPAVDIIDAPRYQWRGFMLDESRHFFGKEKVKQLLDWMAYYKLNKFHWHLTDVNGWRIEIKKYPRLTTVGGVGNYSDTTAAAKYYTQADIKEIVAYAQERFISVIPEIDMPGHAAAANRAYPEFNGGGTLPTYPNFTFDPSNEKTYQYLGDILKEVNQLFPSKIIHLGGDEVSLGTAAWAQNPAIRDMMQKNNFNALTDLEHYFFRRMADTVIKLGNKVASWDEATENDLPADKTVIFWWRQNLPGQLTLALQKKYQVVLCPRLPLYFDFLQDRQNISGRNWNGKVNSINEIYYFPDALLPIEQTASPQVLGLQANLWTEMVQSEKRLDYMTFPRIAALAEAAWTDISIKNLNSFNERLRADIRLYESAGLYYYNPFDPTAHPEAIDFEPKNVRRLEKEVRHEVEGTETHYRNRDSSRSKRHRSSEKRSKRSGKNSRTKKHSSSSSSSSSGHRSKSKKHRR